MMLWHLVVSSYRAPQILPLVRLGCQKFEKTISSVLARLAARLLFWSQPRAISKLLMAAVMAVMVVVVVV